MAELKDGCAKPARGPIVPTTEPSAMAEESVSAKEVKMLARVGQAAIDFEANAYLEGVGVALH